MNECDSIQCSCVCVCVHSHFECSCRKIGKVNLHKDTKTRTLFLFFSFYVCDVCVVLETFGERGTLFIGLFLFKEIRTNVRIENTF